MHRQGTGLVAALPPAYTGIDAIAHCWTLLRHAPLVVPRGSEDDHYFCAARALGFPIRPAPDARSGLPPPADTDSLESVVFAHIQHCPSDPVWDRLRAPESCVILPRLPELQIKDTLAAAAWRRELLSRLLATIAGLWRQTFAPAWVPIWPAGGPNSPLVYIFDLRNLRNPKFADPSPYLDVAALTLALLAIAGCPAIQDIAPEDPSNPAPRLVRDPANPEHVIVLLVAPVIASHVLHALGIEAN